MIGEAKVRNEDLNLCFEKLMMVAAGNGEGVKMNGVGITEWKDIPVELLLRIVSLLDDQTTIVASSVCSGWRDAICMGLTQLCLSWLSHLLLNALSSMAASPGQRS
ncbi:F-box protein SKP2A [Gossypium australe]|uniref:F-box protein SKP2A n=1 Tax=Gossypium australe TaxID=47621 RepID=A0A5B6WVD5_9ROSI|nr:F-box protein SKP2A [Gossypium australe]